MQFRGAGECSIQKKRILIIKVYCWRVVINSTIYHQRIPNMWTKMIDVALCSVPFYLKMRMYLSHGLHAKMSNLRCQDPFWLAHARVSEPLVVRPWFAVPSAPYLWKSSERDFISPLGPYERRCWTYRFHKLGDVFLVQLQCRWLCSWIPVEYLLNTQLNTQLKTTPIGQNAHFPFYENNEFDQILINQYWNTRLVQ